MPLYDFACDCGNRAEIFLPLDRYNELQRCDCGQTMRKAFSPLRVISDIEPYQAMGVDVATGKAPMITSRSQHREYLKRNGYVEVGNDVPKQPPPVYPTKQELARDVKRAIEQTGAKL